MQRVLVRQPGRPLPPGFFTSQAIGRPGNSNVVSHISGSSSSSALATGRIQRFSDSSRSRPPSRNGGKDAKPPATSAAAAAAASSSSSASGSTTSTKASGKRPVGNADDAEADLPDVSEGVAPDEVVTTAKVAIAAIPSVASKKASLGRSGGMASSGKPSSSSLSSSAHFSDPPSWLRGINAVPLLSTHPSTIALDQFYSAGRPLLEVTVPPSHRHAPSHADKRRLETTNESKSQDEAADKKAKAAQDEDESVADMPGEYDAYLITEPTGADPAWGSGADRFLASMDHTVAPPIPTEAKVASGTTGKTLEERHASNQSAVDYLFPIQAEQRRQAAEDARIATARQSIPAYVQRQAHAQRAYMRTPAGMLRRQQGTNMPSQSLAYRFLNSQEVKSKWSEAWDFEEVRKAISGIVQRIERGTASKAASGNTSPDGSEGMKKPLERLRQTSRSVRLRSPPPASRRTKRDANVTRHTMPSGGELVIINMPTPTELAGENATAEDKAAIAKELTAVIQQAGKFSDFFNKNSNDLAEGAQHGESGDSRNLQVEFIHVDELETPHNHLGHIQNGSSVPTFMRTEDVMIMEEDESEHSEMDIRSYGLVGPRMGIVQAWRGRHLRPTLEERLAARGVELVGKHKEHDVHLDSVKRKRRKRISKHKYKKRRKVTRAERRRTGK